MSELRFYRDTMLALGLNPANTSKCMPVYKAIKVRGQLATKHIKGITMNKKYFIFHSKETALSEIRHISERFG